MSKLFRYGKGMILIRCLVLSILLSGCGAGGGSEPGLTDDGIPDNLPPTCKTLYSVWNSTSDLESHDLTGLANGAVVQEYQYKASDGVTCGYATNPNHNLSAEMVTATGGTYHWSLNMVASLAMGGTCGTYTPPGSIGNRYSNAVISMLACNELTICEPAGAGLCKTFH